MSSPEQRFEVPPEYAEVYERAYRRAYEEGSGSLGTANQEPARLTSRGKRAAIPEQRSTRRHRPEGRRGDSPGAARSHVDRRRRTPDQDAAAPVRATGQAGRRADRSSGSTVLPVLGLAGLVVVLVVGAFLLGRVTAGQGQSSAGSGSASEDRPSSGPAYDGDVVPATVVSASAGCTALPGRDAGGAKVSYAVDNVLDDDPDTAWRCDGHAVGQVLTFDLAAATTVVQVGIVPGLARSDPSTGTDDFVRNNRITRVSWTFDDGTVVDQRLGDDPGDRSLRTVAVPRTSTGVVRLEILGVTRGEQDDTVISTVRIDRAG